MRFEYWEPESLVDAMAMLNGYREKAKILAGGTDLVVQLRQGTSRPQAVIHIGRIRSLEGVSSLPGGGVRIGTLTTMRAVQESEQLGGSLDILRQSAAQVSCPQIRNVATLGGNTCNGIPSADTVPALVALGADALILGPQGERRVLMENFHVGPGKTVLHAEELLKAFHIPPPPSCTGGCYVKYTPRGTFELSIVGVAALITLDPGNGTCRDARVVLGACAPTPLRVKRAEAVLIGKRLHPALIEEAGQIAAEEARPNPGVSVRASVQYRREMAKVWTRHALRMAWMNAESSFG
jgi:aerobic carbon-monoxide dehydrogenase medium subunit